MPLARIITRTRKDALPLANRLEAHGYTVEIVGRGNESRDSADLEIELDTMEPHQALAHAARLSRGKQVNVFIAPGCLDEPLAESEPASVAEQLLDAARAKRSTEPEPVEVPVQMIPWTEREDRQAPPRNSLSRGKSAVWIADLRANLQAFARDVATHSRALLACIRPVLRKLQLGTESAFAVARRKSAVERTHLRERWVAYRRTRAATLQHRQEAKIEQLRHGELERARHLLEQQEEKRREIIHKRMAEEERAKQRFIEEQLRRVREAEEEERRQMEREGQLERQRQEAVRLAQERERVARERAERDRLAEEARRIRAEEAERRRRERDEQVLLQRREGPNPAEESQEKAHDEYLEQPQQLGTFEPQPPLEAPVSADDPSVEVVPAYALAEQIPHSRLDSDLNSPYHPGWTWAAAAAGAATVGIMLLWTAVSASRSVVRFEALSPSSLLPARASQLQQQVPFGPVKVVVQKSGTAPVKMIPAAAPVATAPVSTTPVSTAPLAVPAKQPIATAKPSAAKSQAASSDTTDTADSGPEVVTRHFTLPAKPQVPQAGQTATVKRYSDMN